MGGHNGVSIFRFTMSAGVLHGWLVQLPATTLLADSCVFYSGNRTRIQNGSRGMIVS